MKIAFIMSYPVLSSTNGIVSQAKTWKQGLESMGHSVTLLNMWDKNDWESFDIIHFFGFSVYMRDLVKALVKINPNIVCSPILDPDYSIKKLKFYTKWGSDKLGLTNRYYVLSTIKNDIKLFLSRSNFENSYITQGFGILNSNSKVVPLSFEVPNTENTTLKKREPFCLHISLLMDERKNVKRLIEAAKKYKFKLILGGKIHNQKDLEILNSWINGYDNIQYLGFLSYDKMISLYSSAKVFALPSINEGVGIVALEAAALGCDIVITNIGGPKEYYNKFAKQVDPYNIDEIGQSIVKLINSESSQPELANHVTKNFNLDKISNKLIASYQSIL